METTNDNMVHGSGGGSSSGGGGSSSRWNPTKEQLSMLEGLYDQGIRTPSTEQIQSVTKKLQVYGHVEGKNVFYWFQNNKARQKQKQKMDQMTSANNNINNMNNNVVDSSLNNNGNAAAYFNQFYYSSPPLSPSVEAAAGGSHPLFQGAPRNVAYSRYYIAQPELGFYPRCPKMVLPSHLLNKSQTSSHICQDFHRENIVTYAALNAPNVGTSNSYPNNGFGERSGQVTLDLFPLHPTGILCHREHRSPSIESSTENSLEAGSDQDRPSDAHASLSPPSEVGLDVFSKMGW